MKRIHHGPRLLGRSSAHRGMLPLLFVAATAMTSLLHAQDRAPRIRALPQEIAPEGEDWEEWEEQLDLQFREPRIRIKPADVEQRVFGDRRQPAGVRQMLEAALSLRIDRLRLCSDLTEIQQKKLRLAGQGDIKRFFERVEQLKDAASRQDLAADEVQPLLQQCQELKNELGAGLFDPGSLFDKTRLGILTKEQSAALQADQSARRDYHYRANILLLVQAIDAVGSLTALQRTRLTALLENETHPPPKLTELDYRYTIYQFSKIPQDKILAILDPSQHKAIASLYDDARTFEPELRGARLLEAADKQALRNKERK
jgi:hypothetical protein